MTSAEREATILGLEPLVSIVAKKTAASIPVRVEMEDLISAGWVGAIDAVDRFDAARNVPLAVYARWRIRGAIRDYLRSVDHLSRGHRRCVTRAEEEAPITISIDRQEIDSELLPNMEDVLPNERATRERLRHDARIELQAIYRRAGLKPRNAKVLRLYMEGETMKAIGQLEGVNESRICQICSHSIRKLRAAA